jgi:hypothetical protein
VRFSDCLLPRGYVTEFYDDSLDPWHRTLVPVTLGEVTSGIDAALAGGTTGGGGGGGGGGLPPAPPTVTTIASFAPAGGPVDTDVVIAGSGFTGATAVRFNGLASTFRVDADTQITATVPAAASAGAITVTTAQGTTTSVAMFAVSHARTLGLRIGRTPVASGVVGVDDAFSACRRHATVVIQRFTAGGWRFLMTTIADDAGRYRVGLFRTPGRYRARLRRVTLASGDVCEASVSRALPFG